LAIPGVIAAVALIVKQAAHPETETSKKVLPGEVLAH
jgi:hypothetical protein